MPHLDQRFVQVTILGPVGQHSRVDTDFYNLKDAHSTLPPSGTRTYHKHARSDEIHPAPPVRQTDHHHAHPKIPPALGQEASCRWPPGREYGGH
jgi:hypothetical protein